LAEDSASGYAKVLTYELILSLFFSELNLNEVFCRAGRWKDHKGCRLPHHLPPARGRLSHSSWGMAEGLTTSPPVTDTRAGSSLHTPEGIETSVGEVGATTSPTVVDVDPIRAVPDGAKDVAEDQPQIDLAPGGPEASGA
jgi:hypothetical protein